MLIPSCLVLLAATCFSCRDPGASEVTTFSSPSCPADFKPVCGLDGKTYRNSCEAWLKNAAIDCEGQCPCAVSMPWLDYFCDPGALCPSDGDTVCGIDMASYSSACPALYKSCVPVKALGECPGPVNCDPEATGCTTEWKPVCGVDGRTYGNYCEALYRACTPVACEGLCPCGYGCLPSQTCPEIDDPVCGIDGVTYANQCEAECAPIPVACHCSCPCP